MRAKAAFFVFVVLALTACGGGGGGGTSSGGGNAPMDQLTGRWVDSLNNATFTFSGGNFNFSWSTIGYPVYVTSGNYSILRQDGDVTRWGNPDTGLVKIVITQSSDPSAVGASSTLQYDLQSSVNKAIWQLNLIWPDGRSNTCNKQ